ITGNTVAKGYFKNDAITNEKFGLGEVDGKEERSYLTGDLGYFKDGMLFCEGRIDFQVKLHGHRIELEDIDNNLLKNKKIRQAATVPSYEEGKVKSLTSFVVYNEEIEKRFEVTKQLKHELKKLVPEYMMPKKIVFLDEMPLNNNGKIDKKKLKELV
ncbi:MAG: AMP-binding protein, partial [Gemella haemolysans]